MFTKYPTFEEAVKATGKNFTYEQSICGSYHLFCDGELIIDGSACEDLNGTEQDAKDFFANLIAGLVYLTLFQLIFPALIAWTQNNLQPP